MRTLNSSITQNPLRSFPENIYSEDSKYIQNLKFIFSAENYCLRRFPRIVNFFRSTHLYNLLSDHVSILMDRINRLEIIFKKTGIKCGGKTCTAFKSILNKSGNIILSGKLKNDGNHMQVISMLLEVSIYRSYIYNSLLQSTSEYEDLRMKEMLNECLREEDDFFHALLRAKKLLNPTIFIAKEADMITH